MAFVEELSTAQNETDCTDNEGRLARTLFSRHNTPDLRSVGRHGRTTQMRIETGASTTCSFKIEQISDTFSA